jgi:hypothetical protein
MRKYVTNKKLPLLGFEVWSRAIAVGIATSYGHAVAQLAEAL